MLILIQVAGGVLYANLFEWVAHKYILHGLGKKRGSVWHFHWTHHYRCRKSRNNYDPAPALRDHVKESASIGMLLTLHVPLLLTSLAPFAGTVIGMGILYLILHRVVHQFPAWGKRWVPWHYDHHLGPDQDANWCVTFPIWDYILGTRKRR